MTFLEFEQSFFDGGREHFKDKVQKVLIQRSEHGGYPSLKQESHTGVFHPLMPHGHEGLPNGNPTSSFVIAPRINDNTWRYPAEVGSMLEYLEAALPGSSPSLGSYLLDSRKIPIMVEYEPHQSSSQRTIRIAGRPRPVECRQQVSRVQVRVGRHGELIHKHEWEIAPQILSKRRDGSDGPSSELAACYMVAKEESVGSKTAANNTHTASASASIANNSTDTSTRSSTLDKRHCSAECEERDEQTTAPEESGDLNEREASAVGAPLHRRTLYENLVSLDLTALTNFAQEC